MLVAQGVFVSASSSVEFWAGADYLTRLVSGSYWNARISKLSSCGAYEGCEGLELCSSNPLKVILLDRVDFFAVRSFLHTTKISSHSTSISSLNRTAFSMSFGFSFRIRSCFSISLLYFKNLLSSHDRPHPHLSCTCSDLEFIPASQSPSRQARKSIGWTLQVCGDSTYGWLLDAQLWP